MRRHCNRLLRVLFTIILWAFNSLDSLINWCFNFLEAPIILGIIKEAELTGWVKNGLNLGDMALKFLLSQNLFFPKRELVCLKFFVPGW